MKFNKIEEKSTITIEVVFDKEEWKGAQEKAYAKLAKNVEVKGFRKGAAPLEMAKKHIAAADMYDEAVSAVAQKAYEQVMSENDFDLILRPDYQITKISDLELEIKFIFTVRPEVTLGQYKDLEIKMDKVRVTAKEVEAKLSEMQAQFATMSIKEDGVIEKGNVVKFDFEGFVDGVAFPGGSAKDFELEIGSGQFIPGFEDQMIGLKAGEQKDINVVFPEQYTKELAGKPAVFKLNIKEVSVKTLPALDDDLALDAAIEGVNTLEELKAHIKEDISHQKTHEAEDKAFGELLDTVVKNATLEVPEKVIEEDLNNSYQSFTQRVASQGMTMEKYFEIANTNEEDTKAHLREDVVKNLTNMFVLSKIADVEKIGVSNEDIDAEYQAIADQYNMEVSKVKEVLKDRENELSNQIYSRKITTFLRENNKFVK